MKNQEINNDSFELIDYRDKFFRISNKIFDEGLDVYEIGIYTVLCRFANNQSSMSYPSITKICNMLKISRPKAITTINKLAEKAIILKKQGNTGFSNRYYLKNLPSKPHLLVNDIDGVVNHIDGVVNDVYPIKTNKKDSIKKTNKKILFIKPTIERIVKYIKEKKYTVNPEKFFNYYTISEWKDIHGKAVKNWKLKLFNWNERDKDSNQSSNNDDIEKEKRLEANRMKGAKEMIF